MKYLLALVLAFVPVLAQADGILVPTPSGNLLIPDGSVVIDSYTVYVSPLIYGVDFSGPGYTGSTQGNFYDGGGGFLNFTGLTTDLTLEATLAGASGMLFVYDGPNLTVAGGYCNDYLPGFEPCGTSTMTIPGQVTSIQWGTEGGYSGVDSMTFTDPPLVSTPEYGSTLDFMLVFLGAATLWWLATDIARVFYWFYFVLKGQKQIQRSIR